MSRNLSKTLFRLFTSLILAVWITSYNPRVYAAGFGAYAYGNYAGQYLGRPAGTGSDLYAAANSYQARFRRISYTHDYDRFTSSRAYEYASRYYGGSRQFRYNYLARVYSDYRYSEYAAAAGLYRYGYTDGRYDTRDSFTKDFYRYQPTPEVSVRRTFRRGGYQASVYM